MVSETVETYNQIADNYDAAKSPYWQTFPDETIEKFKQQLPSGQIVDLGGGTGFGAERLARLGLTATNFDASISMLQQSKGKAIPSVLAVFNPLPIKDESVAGIWAHSSLLHLPKADFPSALLECDRVLKPQGILYLVLKTGVGEEIENINGQKRLFSYYQQDEVRALLNLVGFRTINFEQHIIGSRNTLEFLAIKDVN